MSELLGEKNLEQRIEEIKEIIKRMDTRWDHGLVVDEEEYLQSRIKLQIELEQLNPIPENDLEQAADLLENFKYHWNRLEGDEEGRSELVKLIVDRIYVSDCQVKVITLRSNYHLVLGHNINGPTPVEVDPFLYQSGSDGGRSLTCITWVILLVPKHIAQQYLSEILTNSYILSHCQQPAESLVLV